MYKLNYLHWKFRRHDEVCTLHVLNLPIKPLGPEAAQHVQTYASEDSVLPILDSLATA